MSDSNPNKDPSLLSKVTAWINKTGYPLEMRVCRVLKQYMRDESSSSVIQSDYYEDPIEGKDREIDLLAVRSVGSLPDQSFVLFVIECKRATKAPWLAFTSETAMPATLAFQKRPTSTKAYKAKVGLATNECMMETELLRIPVRTGFNLISVEFNKARSGGSEPNKAYGSLKSVLSASKDYIEKHSAQGHVSMAFPMVIIEGQLFEAWDSGEDIECQEVDHVVMELRQAVSPGINFIHVMTENGFNRKVAGFSESAMDLARLMYENMGMSGQNN